MADYNFYAWFVASKVGKGGLTPTVDVRNSSGTLVVTDGQAVELGGGLYKFTHTTATLDDYAAVFKTADGTVDAQHVPSLVPVQIMRIDATISSRVTMTPGSTKKDYTLTRNAVPIADATVEVFTEAAMTNLIASGITDAFGVVTFYLDPGTYYLKRTKAGWNFINPDTEVV